MRAYTANMIPGGTTPTINVSQYDNDYAVTVTLIEGAEIYTPPVGATIRVEGTKPDGHGFEYPCTYQGNVVTMPIYTQMTVLSGRFPIELVVYQSGLRVGSCNIIFAVEKAPLGEDTDISETVIPDIIDAAQASAEAAQEAAETAQEAAAEVLSSQIVTSASGSVAAFSDGANDVAVKSLVATITPVQSGSGDPSPTNIRPISGRTGLTIDATAANIWDGEVTLGGYYDATGAWRDDSTILGITNAIPVRPGMQLYCYSANGAAVYVSLFSRMVTIGASATDAFISRTRRENQSFTIPDGAECLYFNFASTYGTTYQNDVSINYPSTVQTMSPTARLIPIDWQTQAGAIYGGTLDVVSGVLTVEYGKYTIPSDITVSDRITSQNRVYWNFTDMANGVYLTDARTVCNRLPKSAPSQSAAIPCICIGATADGSYVYLQGVTHIDGVTDLATLRTWLANNPVEFTYKLATPPAPIQLSPTEIKTLLGGNTIYTDAGAVSVTYVADTKKYIDNKIAELQALVLEN